MKRDILFFILLISGLIAVYSNSLQFDFTHLDDQVQVVNNTAIRSLNWENLRTIFSSTSVGMYQPFTTLLYALAYQLDSLNPYAFSVFSLAFHVLNCSLIFILLKKLQVDTIARYFLVALFAFHPMQVESVVWVSAFSTLVFTFFYILSFTSFIESEQHNSKKSYWLSLFLFLLACFSKSMAITLPVILTLYLIIKKPIKEINWVKLVPYYLISIVFGLITIFSREAAGHLSDLSVQFNWFDRIFLISYSVLFYPFKFLFPLELSVFYPYPELNNGALPWIYYVSLPALLGLFILIWKYRKNSFILFGAGFYLISIALVLQIIPVGNQLTTDRYIYLPLVGLLIILAHLIKNIKPSITYLLLIIPVLLAFKSHNRTAIWENDGLIWEDVIEQYPKVAQAHNNLGSYLLTKNQQNAAFKEFNLAIKQKPYYADAYSNRGNLLAQQGKIQEAIADFNKAIELRPHSDAYFNRANIYAQQDQLQQAIADYSESLALKKSADTYTNRAFAYLKINSPKQALSDLNKALAIKPNFSRAYFLMGMSYQFEQQPAKACSAFQRASALGSQNAKAAYRDYCLNQ